MSIIIALIIFSIIVIIHEFGHFIAAKKNDIMVEEFAIGMGPKIFSIKKGETVYSLRLFPIGGFCQMLGEDTNNSSERSFNNKTVWQRIIVVVAGAAMNFLLAFFIFVFIVSINGVALPKVKSVIDGYPAQKAGILPGDYIKKINGNKVNISQDLSFYISDAKDNFINLIVQRNGKELQFDIKPMKDENGQYLLGFEKDLRSGIFSSADLNYKKINVFEIFYNAFFTIAFYIKLTFVGLFRLISFKLSLNDMSGPIGIVKVIGDTYNLSVTESISYALQAMMNFMAILSANIGVFNLLPLPALDGGRLFFLLFEAVRKKPLNSEREGFIHFVGFVVLMIFAVIIAVNDIIKII